MYCCSTFKNTSCLTNNEYSKHLVTPTWVGQYERDHCMVVTKWAKSIAGWGKTKDKEIVYLIPIHMCYRTHLPPSLQERRNTQFTQVCDAHLVVSEQSQCSRFRYFFSHSSSIDGVMLCWSTWPSCCRNVTTSFILITPMELTLHQNSTSYLSLFTALLHLNWI
jgi:hypothetical protein